MKWRELLLMVIIVPVFVCSVSGQQKSLDSLLQANTNYLNEDSNKVKLLIDIAREYRKLRMTKERFVIIDQAIALGEKIKFYKALPQLYNYNGLYYEGRSEFEKSIFNYERAIALSEQLGDKEKVAGYSLNYGTVYQQIGDYPRALTLYQKSANYYINIGDEENAANAYVNMGSVFNDFPGHVANGLVYFEKALKSFQKMGSARGIVEVYMNMAQTYLTAPDAELREFNVDPGKRNEIARDYLDKSMKIAVETKNDPTLLAAVKSKLGLLEERLGNYGVAEKNYNEAMKIFQEADQPNYVFVESINIGRVYQKQNNFTAAFPYLYRGISGARQIKSLELQRDGLLSLSEVHERVHQFDSAYSYYREYIKMRDSIYSAEKEKEITRKQLRFEFGMKEREYQLSQQIADDKILRQKQEINLRNKQLELTQREKEIEKLGYLQKQAQLENQKNLQANQLKAEHQKAEYDRKIKDQQINVQNVELNANRRLSIFLGILAVIILSAATLLYNSRQKTVKLNRLVSEQKLALEDLVKVKDKIFSIVSHDMRAPVNNLIAFSSLLEEGEIGQEKLALYLEQIKSTLDHTSSMMENLLNWSASQMQGFTPVIEDVNISSVVEQVTHGLSYAFTKKKILLNNTVREDVFVKGDRNMVELITRNLLSNAVKFSNPGGSLDIFIEQKGEKITLSVRDNGVGMSQEKADAINNSSIYSVVSTQGTAKEKGTGLGLMLCKHFAAMMQGNIHVQSEPGKGSTFNMILPASLAA